MEGFHYDYVSDNLVYQIYILYIKNIFWFKAVDVSAALQHKCANQIILNCVAERDRRAWGDIAGLNGRQHKKWRQEATFITMRGVRTLMNSTRAEHAEPFKKWLYEHVLPDIKKILDAFRYTSMPNTLPSSLDLEPWQKDIGKLKRLGLLKNYYQF